MNSSNKEIIRGTSGYFLANIISAGFNFIFVILATRVLGASGYGLIALGATVFALSNNFGLFGFGFYSQKVLAGKFDRKKGEILGSMFSINFAISILVFLVLFLGSGFISENIFNKPEFSLVLKVIAFAVLFSLPTGLFRVILRSQKKVKKNLFSICLEGFLKLIFLGLVLFFDNNLLIVSGGVLFGSFGSFLFTFSFLVKEKLLPAFTNLKINIKKTLLLSSQFLIVGMGYFLSSQTDRLMLGGMVSSEELGYYAIAASMAMIMSQLHGSMVSIFMPMISETYKKGKKEELKRIYSFSNIFSFLVSSSIFIFFLFSGIFILKIFSIDNIGVVYFILMLLSFRAFMGSLTGPTGALLNMADRHKLEFLNTGILVCLNIILNYFMIKQYGALGAAFATLISSLVFNLIQVVEIYKIYKFFIFKKIHFVFLVFNVSVALVYYLIGWQSAGLLWNIAFLVFAEAFLLFVFYLFLNEDQKRFISHHLDKFKIKLLR